MRYPMPHYVELEDDESAAIFAYLRTVPILVGPHRHQEATMILSGSVGQRVYEKYGREGLLSGLLPQTLIRFIFSRILRNASWCFSVYHSGE